MTAPQLGTAAARGVGITLVAQLLRSVIQFGSLIVLARLLAPDDFGLVASVVAIIGVADILRDFGLSTAAIQARTLSDDERTNLFWVNAGIGAGCAVVIVACAPLIDRLYGQPLYPVTLALASVFVLSGLDTQFSAELARGLRFRSLATSEVSGQLAGAVAGIALAASGAGYWAIVVQQIVPVVVVLALNVRACPWRPGAPRRHVSIRRFLRFGGAMLLSQVIAYSTNNVDNVAVGVARGTVALGYYSRAFQLLVMPLRLINAPMTRVALPVLSRVQDDDEVYARYLGRAQLVACYVTATVLAMASGLAAPIVAVLFGPRWTDVVPIFAILAAGGVFRSVEQISYWMYLSRAKMAAQLKLYLWTRPAMLVLIALGVIWGAVGVATTSSIAFFLYWIVSLVAAGRATGVDVRPLFAKAWQAILLVAAPCGVVAYAGTLLVDNPVLQLALGIVLAAGWVGLVVSLLPVVRQDATLVVRYGRTMITRTASGAPVG